MSTGDSEAPKLMIEAEKGSLIPLHRQPIHTGTETVTFHLLEGVKFHLCVQTKAWVTHGASRRKCGERRQNL